MRRPIDEAGPVVVAQPDQGGLSQRRVQQVGGLPLALTLIGHHLRVHAYNGQSRRIHAELAELLRSKEWLQMSCVPSPLEAMPAGTRSSISLQTRIRVSEQHLSACLFC